MNGKVDEDGMVGLVIDFLVSWLYGNVFSSNIMWREVRMHSIVGL